MDGPAHRAGPLADAERLRAVLYAAGRADLAGRLEPAHLGERAAVLSRLLSDAPDQLGPAGVGDRLGQTGPGQPGYGEVFGVDRLVVADQPESRLVRVIQPGLSHLAVHHRDPAPGLGPVRGALPPAGQHPLRPAQPPLRRPV